MSLDYDIYSYLARGLGSGYLKLEIVREKIKYQLIKMEEIDLMGKYADNYFRCTLQILDRTGKKIFDKDNKPIVKYVDESVLEEDYEQIDNKIYKSKKNELIVVQVPEAIKVPSNFRLNKNIFIRKGTWIDITNVDHLKFYSNKEFKLRFEVLEEDIKIKKNCK